MPREYAKTNLTIWQDPEWRALPWPAQHLYKMLWEHPGLSYCGVVRWRPAPMLGWGGGWTAGDMLALANCLRARHFLVVDEDTEECLIRSWIRFDGVLRQPRLSVSMTNAFGEVGSNDIRGVIVDELRKLKDREAGAAGWTKPQVQDLLRLPVIDAKTLANPEDPFATGFAIGLGTGLGSVSGSISEAFGGNATSGFGSGLGSPYNSNSNIPTATSSSSAISTPVADLSNPGSAEVEGNHPREDVERICRHLVERIVANGGKPPGITRRWADAARLMLDKDGYTETQVLWLIDKAQDDEFWRANVLSLPKLREKANALKLKFADSPSGPTANHSGMGWGKRRRASS